MNCLLVGPVKNYDPRIANDFELVVGCNHHIFNAEHRIDLVFHCGYRIEKLLAEKPSYDTLIHNNIGTRRRQDIINWGQEHSIIVAQLDWGLPCGGAWHKRFANDLGDVNPSTGTLAAGYLSRFYLVYIAGMDFYAQCDQDVVKNHSHNMEASKRWMQQNCVII